MKFYNSLSLTEQFYNCWTGEHDAVQWAQRGPDSGRSDFPSRVILNMERKLQILDVETILVNVWCINLQAPCILYIGQAFRYSPEIAFYIFNQQIYFII